MIDPETREILQMTLQHLRTQVVYVRNLHDSLSALYDALKQDLPKLEENHRAEMVKIRDNAPQTQLLAEIDALLQRLNRTQE